MINTLLDYISVFLALIIVLPLHEFAHAFAAVKNGDDTPKYYGRYTLNPFAHFDAVGLLCFILCRFGWAKPVPINPNNFKNYKKGSFWVSVSGVLANYITAFLFYPLFVLSIIYLPEIGYFTTVLQTTLLYAINFSLVFFVFNLIPVYPLDGFRVVDCFVKNRGPVYYFLRKKGIYVLYLFFALSIVADITGVYQIDILGNFLSLVVGYIQIPITAFWGLIF